MSDITLNTPLSMRKIVQTWWPLAASWLLMAAEMPVISAVVARLAEPEINLAAYGGVVFPLALIIESPIIMLLAASTALSKDWNSYCKLRRFMMVSGSTLTVLHILIAFTPLYYVVVEGIIGVPQEVVEPARIGLMIMTPWTWSIAFRRFHQGVLIRFGHSQPISVGSMVRLTADALVLTAGYLIGDIPGVVVGTGAVAAGVVFEAIFIGIVVRPVLNNQVKVAKPVREPVTLRSFLDFYIPLAMTSLLTLVVQPMGSAALSRMPDALNSLAVWPVLTGLIFMVRGMGTAYNEVVVALLDEPNSVQSLRRFAILLASLTTAGVTIIAATPLAHFWFADVSALNPQLVALAKAGIWIGLPLPALTVLQSWFQGLILNGKRTRIITESVVIFLVASVLILWAGVAWGELTGLFVGMGAFVLSTMVQIVWLWYRSRAVLDAIQKRGSDQAGAEVFNVGAND